MQRPVRPLTPDDRVLIVRLGAVGDVLRSLPALRQLRVAFPGSHLAWAVEDLSAPLLEGHPDLDQLIVLRRADLRRAAGNPVALARLVRRLRTELTAARFSVAVDLQSSFKSALLTLLSGAPRRVGYAPGFCREMSFLFTTEWLPLASPWLNRVEKHLAMASALGAPRLPRPRGFVPESAEEAREAAAILAGGAAASHPPVIVSPGVSRRQSFKAWPPGHYARLMTLMHGMPSQRCLVVWGPGEEELATSIVRASGGTARLAPRTSLGVLAAILRRSAAFIGADTGTMHLAWMVGCRVVALFGPTDPRLNAPMGEGHVVLRSPSESMRDLTPQAALDGLRRVLDLPDPLRSPPAAAPDPTAPGTPT